MGSYDLKLLEFLIWFSDFNFSQEVIVTSRGPITIPKIIPKFQIFLQLSLSAFQKLKDMWGISFRQWVVQLWSVHGCHSRLGTSFLVPPWAQSLCTHNSPNDLRKLKLLLSVCSSYERRDIEKNPAEDTNFWLTYLCCPPKLLQCSQEPTTV